MKSPACSNVPGQSDAPPAADHGRRHRRLRRQAKAPVGTARSSASPRSISTPPPHSSSHSLPDCRKSPGRWRRRCRSWRGIRKRAMRAAATGEPCSKATAGSGPAPAERQCLAKWPVRRWSESDSRGFFAHLLRSIRPDAVPSAARSSRPPSKRRRWEWPFRESAKTACESLDWVGLTMER